MAEHPAIIGGRYEVQAVMEGREHTVYHAIDGVGFQREVALVAPNSTLCANAEDLIRFVEESRQLGNLNSPEIVEVYDFIEKGTWDGNYYLVREWMDKCLADVMEDAIHPLATTAIIGKVLRGVQAIHAIGMVHCALTPTDIFISSDFEQVKIGGLGIAAPIGGSPFLSERRISPQYMDPAVFRSDLPVSESADIYSIGLIAYQLLLGRESFEQEFEAIYNADMEEVRNERWFAWHRDPLLQARPLSDIDPDLPKALSDLIARMMAKEPADRYANVVEVLADLEAIGRTPGVSAQAPRPAAAVATASTPTEDGAPQESKLVQFLKSWQGVTAIGGVFLLLLLVVVIATSDGGIRKQVLEQRKQMEQARAEAVTAKADLPPLMASWASAEEAKDRAETQIEEGEWDQAKSTISEATKAYRQAILNLAVAEREQGFEEMREARERALREGAEVRPVTEFSQGEAERKRALGLKEQQDILANQAVLLETLKSARSYYELALGQLREAAARERWNAARGDVERLRQQAIATQADEGPTGKTFAKGEALWAEANKSARGEGLATRMERLTGLLSEAEEQFRAALLEVEKSRRQAQVAAELQQVIALRDRLIEQGIEEYPSITAFALGEEKLGQARDKVESADLTDEGQRALVSDLIGNAHSILQLAAEQLEKMAKVPNQEEQYGSKDALPKPLDEGVLADVFGDRAMEFVLIKAGCFHMRVAGGTGQGRRVCLPNDYAISKYEVTQGQFRQFAEATNREQNIDPKCSRDDCPAGSVSWKDAVAYAQWLSKQLGRQYRLPTKAEWDFAVREGTDGVSPLDRAKARQSLCRQGNVYDQSARGPRASGPFGVYNCSDGFSYIAPVGSLEPNSIGLHDLIGNVWEWTCSTYPVDEGHELRCVSGSVGKVALSGGSWQSGPKRFTADAWGQPDDQFQDLGFRLVRE